MGPKYHGAKSTTRPGAKRSARPHRTVSPEKKKPEQQRQMEVVRETPEPPKPRVEEDDDDDYGDDFDDYDEEEVVVMAQAPAMPKVEPVISGTAKKALPPKKIDAIDEIQDAVKSENAATKLKQAALLENKENVVVAESKDPPPETEEQPERKKRTAKAQRQAKFARPGTTRLRFSPAVEDPRVARVKAVRKQITLRCDRYIAFDQPPLTEHQKYRLGLMKKEPKVREIGLGTRDEFVDAGAATEPFDTRDVEMQFALGDDDTDLENLMKKLRQKKDETKEVFDDVDDQPAVGLRRLPAFVRNVAPLIEGLLEAWHSKNADVSDNKALFAGDETANEEWTELGLPEDAASDKTRLVGSLTFSLVRPSLLLAVDTEATYDPRRPGATVWDAVLRRPVASLYGEGAITAACFADTNGYVVAGGTDAGTILVWDLREASPIAASCSTGLYTKGGHVSRVVSIKPNGGGEVGGALQLTSIDDRGLVCVWTVLCGQREEAVDDVEKYINDWFSPLTQEDDSLADGSFIADVGSALKLAKTHSVFVWNSIPRAAMRQESRRQKHLLEDEINEEKDDSDSESIKGAEIQQQFDAVSKYSTLHKGKYIKVGLPWLQTETTPETDAAQLALPRAGTRYDEIIATVGVGPGVRGAAALSDPNEFLVLLEDSGVVARGSLFGKAVPPQMFYPDTTNSIVKTKADIFGSSAVATSVDASPFVPLFLVGLDDGRVFVYSLEKESPLPLVALPCGAPLTMKTALRGIPAVAVKWSRHRPALFFVLHASADLVTYDLLRNASSPVHVCNLKDETSISQEVIPTTGLSPAAPPALALSSAKVHATLAAQIHGRIFVRPLSDMATTKLPKERSRLRETLDGLV